MPGKMRLGRCAWKDVRGKMYQGRGTWEDVPGKMWLGRCAREDVLGSTHREREYVAASVTKLVQLSADEWILAIPGHCDEVNLL